MKIIKEYINEQFNPEWDYVIEMASIGYPVLNKQKHYIALHGAHAGDRKRPHVHIYLENDIRPFSKFNFEIALDEILCYDEINLIRMVDSKKHIDIRNRNKCSWEGYNKLKNDFEDWLFSPMICFVSSFLIAIQIRLVWIAYAAWLSVTRGRWIMYTGFTSPFAHNQTPFLS